jgi:hypothetical protein
MPRIVEQHHRRPGPEHPALRPPRDRHHPGRHRPRRELREHVPWHLLDRVDERRLEVRRELPRQRRGVRAIDGDDPLEDGPEPQGVLDEMDLFQTASDCRDRVGRRARSHAPGWAQLRASA